MCKENVLQVDKSQVKNKIGSICDWDMKDGEDPEYPYVFVCYIAGEFPVKIKSKIPYAEFNKLYK